MPKIHNHATANGKNDNNANSNLPYDNHRKKNTTKP